MNYVPLGKKDIENIFDNSLHQSEYLIALYKKVIPEFDKIQRITEFPVVSKITSNFIFKQAIEFDRKYHPRIFPGGCWMNNGFGTSTEVADWMVMVDETQFVYKEVIYNVGSKIT